KLSKPVTSLDAGTYTEAIKVELTSDVEGVTIKYTIDGSDPITKGINYVKAIDIEKDTVIKAVAIKDGMETSEILELSYVIVIEKIVTLGNMHPETGPFSKVDYANWKTAKYPLGANFVGDDVTFAVYSKNGTKVLLEIYSSAYGEDATYDYWLEKGADNIWRGKIKNLPVNTYYAFRVWGPNWEYDENWKRGNSSVGFIKDVDANGNRFNPNKVIFDPYAKELSHDKEFPEMIDAGESGGMYGTGGADTKIGVSESPHVYSGPQTTKGVEINRRDVDTGKWITKGIVIKPAKVTFNKPNFKEENSIIYEAHVRGISAHSSSSDLKSILDGFDGFSDVVSVPEQYRGTYKGAGYLAKYLKAIGVNVIELLPVHETENDMMPFDGTKATAGSANNFWGYMTSGFFAPERRYAYDKSPGGPTREFQEMVKTFNDEGIKVYLDVVYNHTGEGGNWGNMDVTGFISMGGFDVAEYYHLVPGGSDKNWLVDGATGCGNQLNFSSGKSVTYNLVLDSLKYWMDTMGVNGFRFDLAVVLGRDVDKHSWEPSTTYWDGRVKEFYSTHPLLVGIADLGATYGANMIAEAWDIWGYQVGGFPARWGEWNGRYRDTIRNYMRGQHTSNGVTYADAFNGDYNNFNKHGGPQKSINFIVAHDGFTLTDLVSYNNKMNELTSWPFGPSDGGSDDNQSWDSNGDKDLRRQRLRNFWTYQMFSRGTPMIVYGDEITRTQNGNNNPYNLDSVITWNNYNMINTDEPHGISTGYGGTYHNNLGIDNNLDNKNNLFLFATNVMKLRRDTASLNEAIYSPISFDKADGSIGFNAYDDKAVRIRRGDFLIMSNMAEIEVGFVVPEASVGKKWVRIIDTHNWAEAVN
ncbi:MAG: hypothetical protein GX287_01655, partial [Fusobacteria bacterium]|nr:hypothetical protein [Fusobacteriota bacterium]